ncbi:putative acetyltransferase A, auxiliary subunit [Rosa chinensis]|uniref:Putative acetyltransferase A, auxiliary subunit n=1 Tax=Rosa chinensis TaxID=74649 RepID=A0A2P6PXK5_ROSCH|nr:tetratricopeptide repeat protein 33 isoform X1 [Rosa chinensis]PRQ26661.1 putative acetyltransferase A, auxiliary subunit [Rosa chinensis]
MPRASVSAELGVCEMKLAWKKNKKRPLATVSKYPNLPFDHKNDNPSNQNDTADGELNKEQHHEPLSAQNESSVSEEEEEDDVAKLFNSFQSRGTKLAEDGKYREALGKWESALLLMPKSVVLHEQKAQVLIEIGDAWNAIKAATRATELEPSWAEAWVTLGRAQLNFGEPDSAVQSFDKALAIKPDSEEARDDRHTAMNLMKRRKQLHSSGLSPKRNRYAVGDRTDRT